MDIPVGISACVLGDKVRFDGGHKRSRFAAEELNSYVKHVANNSVNVDSLKEQIKTNKIVSGLSYITILVCITIMYVHYASDLSSNSA